MKFQVIKKNIETNPWYDKDCKSTRKEIKKALNESLKIEKIKIYKALTKREKMQYINKGQENLLHLSNVGPNKFWRNILTRKNIYIIIELLGIPILKSFMNP